MRQLGLLIAPLMLASCATYVPREPDPASNPLFAYIVIGDNSVLSSNVDLAAGGPSFARDHTGPDCDGFINYAPDVSVWNVSGSRSLLLTAVGERGISIVVHDPAGQWWCSGYLSRESDLSINAPLEGEYDIWIAADRPQDFYNSRLNISRIDAHGNGPSEIQQLSVFGQVRSSGFFVSNNGYIATSSFAVTGRGDIHVDVHGVVHEAEVIANDGANDVAILRIAARSSGLRLSPVDSVEPGDAVLIPGFPAAGLPDNTQLPSYGRISAFAGPGANTQFLQIDSQMGLGNVGSPVISNSGYVIGVISEEMHEVGNLRRAEQAPKGTSYAVISDYLISLLPDDAELAPTPLQGNLGEMAIHADATVVRIYAQCSGVFNCDKSSVLVRRE